MLHVVDFDDLQGVVTVVNNDQTHRYTYAEARDLQRLLNEHWPLALPDGVRAVRDGRILGGMDPETGGDRA